MTDRAILFIDGNNWYHGLRDRLQIPNPQQLNYAFISRKLVGHREWVGTRYYIGRVSQQRHNALYSSQRRFLARLVATDRRITCHLGRLEYRRVTNKAADELRRYLGELTVRLPAPVFRDLMQIALRHVTSRIMVEKAVDVQLAVDMLVMAMRDEYDAAYLLSADGDFTPAVTAAREIAKKVYVAAPMFAAQLACVSNKFIRLDRDWFADCFLS